MSNAADRAEDYRMILGVRFFLGTAEQAVERAEPGGLVLVPAAPALKDIAVNRVYREALLSADTVLTDSAFMVMVWNRLEHDNIKRLSGLAYLRALLHVPSFREPGNTMWILPSEDAILSTSLWLAEQGIEVPATHFYAAPMYRIDALDRVIDPLLVSLLEKLRPRHVILGVGGGTQEPLGANLKLHLRYLPAIHCVGAAIAFLTGSRWGFRCGRTGITWDGCFERCASLDGFYGGTGRRGSCIR